MASRAKSGAKRENREREKTYMKGTWSIRRNGNGRIPLNKLNLCLVAVTLAAEMVS